MDLRIFAFVPISFLIFGFTYCKEPTAPPENNPLQTIRSENGLVDILQIDPKILTELRYATSDNFTESVIYPFHTCLLRKETAEKLRAANAEFGTSGYRIKIWDGYRPPYAQKILWEKVPNPRYVGDPNKGGSVHNRGGAVDLTLVDSEGNELEMPSAYDDFSPSASPYRKDLDPKILKNLNLLIGVMTKHGFRQISSEWWHYNDVDSKNYPLVDVDPRNWEK